MRRPRIVPAALRRPPALRAIVAAVVAASLAGADAGCAGRPFAEGSSRELVVATLLPPDSPEILMLRAVVEREALRIDDESSYVVRFARPDNAGAYRSTVLIVAGYGPLDRIPAPCRKLRERLAETGKPYAFVPDLWLRGQVAGIFWAATRDEWVASMARLQNQFYLELDRATFAAVRERVLALPRDDRAERRLRDALGFSVRVPRGYSVRINANAHAALVADDGPPARLLRIRASREGQSGDIAATRAALAKLFRPNEQTLAIADPMLVPDEMAGAVRRLHGRWEDSDVSAAGPFRFYEVWRGPRSYDVDLAVFAPGRPKLPYLRELHVLAETVTP